MGAYSFTQGKSNVREGFRFGYRSKTFEWRLLHGIDVDAVVRLTDVRAVEDCLDTLQHGSLDSERGLSSTNCVHLFRLLQLAIEYLWHLRNAHTSLLDIYAAAITTADRWKASARFYLDTASLFMTSCQASGEISRTTLDTLDDARRRLDECDKQYGAALDSLEEEDQRTRYFHFRKQRVEMHWQALHAIELEELVMNTDVAALEKVLHSLVYGSLTQEDKEELTPAHFAHLIPLAQCGLDLMLYQANASGQALEQSMAALQASCADIPHLTTATQQAHASITAFIQEAQFRVTQLQQQQQQQQQQLMAPDLAARQQTSRDSPWAPPPWAPPHQPPLPPIAAQHQLFMQQQQQQQGVGEGGGGGLTSFPGGAGLPGGQQQQGGLLSQHGGYQGGPWARGPPSWPGGGGAAPGLERPPPGVPAGGPGAAGTLPRVMEEAMALAQAGLLSAGHLDASSRAAQLHHKVDCLEDDLRQERVKTEEMRRLLADIRDRLLSAPLPPSSSQAQGGGSHPAWGGPAQGYESGGGRSDLSRVSAAPPPSHQRTTTSPSKSRMAAMQPGLRQGRPSSDGGPATRLRGGHPSEEVKQLPQPEAAGSQPGLGGVAAGAPQGLPPAPSGPRPRRREARSASPPPPALEGGLLAEGQERTGPDGQSSARLSPAGSDPLLPHALLSRRSSAAQDISDPLPASSYPDYRPAQDAGEALESGALAYAGPLPPSVSADGEQRRTGRGVGGAGRARGRGLYAGPARSQA